MHYVKHFNILGVNTAQIPCIELQGVPNAATEGAVGLLGMNMLSDDHEIYVCVAVNGSVYTWMPIKDGKDGVSIVKTELNSKGELIITLSNGTTSNVGVIKGEKGEPGEKGEQADLSKIQEKNSGRYVSVWLGTKAQYEQLTVKEENTVYIFEDDATPDEIDADVTEIKSDVAELKTKTTELETDLGLVKESIPLLEDEIFNVNNKSDQNASGIATLQESIASHISNYDSKVVEIEADISTLNSDVDTLEGDVYNINHPTRYSVTLTNGSATNLILDTESTYVFSGLSRGTYIMVIHQNTGYSSASIDGTPYLCALSYIGNTLQLKQFKEDTWWDLSANTTLTYYKLK